MPNNLDLVSILQDGFNKKPDFVHIDSKSLHSISDEELCERLRFGSEMALRLLIERHAPTVLRLASNILGDVGDAEDVVQEVFITVWKCRESWVNGSAKFSTWLHRVSINKAIDKRRQRKSTPEAPEVITAASDAITMRDPPADPTAQLSFAEMMTKLSAVIDRLPVSQAQALRYFYFEGREVSAIAQDLGASEQAVRSLLKRGRETLRVRLTKQMKTARHDAIAVRSPDRAVWTGRR